MRLRGAPLTIANLHSPFFVRPLPRHLRQIGVKHDDLRPDETVVRMLRLMSFVRATARQTMIPSRLPFQRHSSPLLLGGLAATSDSLARLASCSPCLPALSSLTCAFHVPTSPQLLREDGIETSLLSYNVEALDETVGLVEWVDAETMSNIIAPEIGGVRRFLGLDSDTRENHRKLKRFQNSLAFYSVANLLLGFGDRHDDNMMVSKDGRFFHIDFGYILGEEPKPFCKWVARCEGNGKGDGGRGGLRHTLGLAACHGC